MSLHVGHIPSSLRQEELEQVFRRYGRCMFQMKDGYGFAVYEVTADAERALRALGGKDICGAPLTLNWSNRQPKPFPRSARSGKVYEPYRRRNFREDGNDMGYRGSQIRRDFSARVPSFNRVKHRDDVLDRRAGYVREDLDVDIGEERGLTQKEGMEDVGNSSEPNPVEIERWGEPVGDGIGGTEMRNDAEFDRYEPDHGYEREDEKHNYRRASSYGSPHHESPQRKRWREHPTDEADKNIDSSKPQPTCYKCGLVGHIKRYCPQEDERGKFSKFSHRRDEINSEGRSDGKLKRPRSSSLGKPGSARDPSILNRQERNRKEHYLGKSRRLVQKSERFRVRIPERREKNRPKLMEESQVKRRSQQQSATRKKVPKKRSSRRFDSSSVSSESSSSSSHTHSRTSKSKSTSNSHSTSRSVSSRSHSLSISSKSASVSIHLKSKSSRSRSRSRSRSPSLSVSLDKKPPSSPRNGKCDVSEERTSTRDSLEHQRSPSSKRHLQDKMGNFEVKIGNGSVTPTIYKEPNGERLGDNVDVTYYSASTSGYKEDNLGIKLPRDDAAVSGGTCTDRHSVQENHAVKLNEQIAFTTEGRNSARITTQEMISALKHYGLPAPEEGDSEISVEGYFGAARLWPWEMIYYRRLKKGPISTENYAKRLEQNKEFGIVDRYIRSSSGWGECKQHNVL